MNKGNALIIVTLVVMLAALFTVTALHLSNRGQDLTARYKDYSGAYEMAVAGNDYAYLILKNALENTDTDESESEPVDFTLEWDAKIETDMTEEFKATTTVKQTGDEFLISTEVLKSLNGKESFPVTVKLLIYFDDSESPVLKSKRL